MYIRKNKASTLIQKYLKGYGVFKQWGLLVHKTIIQSYVDHFRKLKLKIHTNS